MKKKFKTKPYAHQHEALDLLEDRKTFALFLEQGLGKTKIIIDDAARSYRDKDLDGLLVVAPNGVHSNWAEVEVPRHCPDDVDAATVTWSRSRSTRRWRKSFEDLLAHRGLAMFFVNVEALSSSSSISPAVAACERFLKGRRAVMIVDESTRIKTPSAGRTKNVLRLGRLARGRRILTGTPVTQSPFDLFSQFKFLDPSILGFASFYAFKTNYGVFKQREARNDGRTWRYEELVKYKGLEDLRQRIDPHLFRRTKKECLDIPDKIYKRFKIEMSPAQKRLYQKMKDEGIIEFEDFELLAPLEIVRLLRCQQILGGFLPTIQDVSGIEARVRYARPWARIDGPNPKLDVLVSAISEDYPGKCIVWARFRAEIEMIVAALSHTLGRHAIVEMHGGVPVSSRTKAVREFQESSRVRVLVGQQQSGMGITLTAAETVFYYSNSFSYEQRYQSEDRAHRIGQRRSVLYVDLEMAGTVDERIRTVLDRSRRVADEITGDSKRRKVPLARGEKARRKGIIRNKKKTEGK